MTLRGKRFNVCVVRRDILIFELLCTVYIEFVRDILYIEHIPKIIHVR
jgi:hypothetical protein